MKHDIEQSAREAEGHGYSMTLAEILAAQERSTRRARCVLWALFLAGIACLAMAIWTGEARSQTVCLPFPVVADILKTHHGEEQIGRAIVNPTLAIVVFSAPGGKTFSIVTVNPAGIACVLAGGTDWDVGQPRHDKSEGGL